MGNHKFRLLPKSWLLTLKNITIKSTPPKKPTPPKTKTKVIIPQPTPRRQSYYIPSNNDSDHKPKDTDTKYHHFDPPRKISTHRPQHVKTDLDDVFSGLPPIATKPRPKDTTPRAIRTGVKVKVKVRSTSTTTPRLARGVTGRGFAVVTRSDDPQRDFRESMVEMIVENDMASAKELEDLLACYLTLNSEEYHDVIVKVFEQIWFDLRNIRRRCRGRCGNACVASSAGRVN